MGGFSARPERRRRPLRRSPQAAAGRRGAAGRRRGTTGSARDLRVEAPAARRWARWENNAWAARWHWFGAGHVVSVPGRPSVGTSERAPSGAGGAGTSRSDHRHRLDRAAGTGAIGPSSPRRHALLMSQLPDPSGPTLFRCDAETTGETGRVAPVGEVDLATVGEVAAHLSALLATGVRRLVLDLRGVTFMDSTGVRLLLERQADSRRDGYAFAVVPGPTRVQRVLELAGVTDHLSFEEA